MKQICLFGPSEHDREVDLDQLAADLAALGLQPARLPLGADPPANAHALLINTKTRLTRAVLHAMPRLELCVTTTSGHDHIDLAAARARGIAVVRCPLARRDAVVDASLALALSLLRRLPRCREQAAHGRWIRAEMKAHAIPTVRDLTVGIFGLGVIGARARDAWTALGARVLAADPLFPDQASAAEIFAQADIISLHCSLSDSSRGILDAGAIQRLKRGAILVNTARGECVDLDAALAADHLGGLGLDVFGVEPPPALARIALRDDVIVTPHSAGYHAGLAAALRVEVLAAVRAWLRGAVPHGAL